MSRDMSRRQAGTGLRGTYEGCDRKGGGGEDGGQGDNGLAELVEGQCYAFDTASQLTRTMVELG